jgi:hypothetical protein
MKHMCPFILVDGDDVDTGHRSAMDQLIQEVISEGANAVCHKPFDVPLLLTMLPHLTAAEAAKNG